MTNDVAARLGDYVAALPGPRSRLHHPAAMDAAQRLLLDAWSDAGWATATLPFTLRDAVGITDHDDYVPTTYARLDGANLVAVKEGELRSAVVVGAHLDTVRDSPGACDNGAGVAALVELADRLGPLALRHTVVLAAFDMEEIGVLGAPELVHALRAEREVVAAIVLESIGCYDPRPGAQTMPAAFGALFPRVTARLRGRGMRGDWTALIHRRDSATATAALARAIRASSGPHAVVRLRDPLDLPVLGRVLSRVAPTLRHLARSDHSAFWAAGIPAVLVTDTANFRMSHYHRESDTVDTLDLHHLGRLVDAIATAVTELAGPVRG